MTKYSYTVPSFNIWCSFDNGFVHADNLEEAKVKAIEELKYNFAKANEALKHCDTTLNFSIEFDESEVNVREVRKRK